MRGAKGMGILINNQFITGLAGRGLTKTAEYFQSLPERCEQALRGIYWSLVEVKKEAGTGSESEYVYPSFPDITVEESQRCRNFYYAFLKELEVNVRRCLEEDGVTNVSALWAKIGSELEMPAFSIVRVQEKSREKAPLAFKRADDMSYGGKVMALIDKAVAQSRPLRTGRTEEVAEKLDQASRKDSKYENMLSVLSDNYRYNLMKMNTWIKNCAKITVDAFMEMGER